MISNRALTLAILILLVGAGPLFAGTTVLLVNLDDPGEGLNDPAAVAPVGGNTGTTLGEARKYAVEFAAAVWAEQLESPVPMRIGVSFDPLGGTSTAATLGLGSAGLLYRDFTGAPYPATWYVAALAEKHAGIELGGTEPDLEVVFNSDVDGDLVLGPSHFYYGFDAAPPGEDVDFVSVVLHEMAHGLGFKTFADTVTGAKLNGFDDPFLLHLEHHGAQPSDLASMSDSQRAVAFTAEPDLHWIGPSALAAAGALTAGVSPEGHVEMYAPGSLEVGNTGSHFATSLAPDELMEPFYSGESVTFDLVLGVLEDIGWGAAPVCEAATLP